MKLQDFNGLVVNHIKFGYGIIENIDSDDRINIIFDTDTKKFKFPDIFDNFIKFEDSTIQQYVDQLIKTKKEQQQLEKEEKIKQWEEQEQRKKEEYEFYIKNKYKIKSIEKKHLYFKNKHEKEFPYSTFLVYQGKTWKYESKEQILCIHKEDFNRGILFWDIISELKCLDIILHCKGQFLCAISRVTKEMYETNIDDKENDIPSLKVNCNYIILNNPVDLRQFREDIKQYNIENKSKYSPFNKRGLGNQGYLFSIDRNLAQAFVVEATRNNSNLLEVDYINELLDLYN